MNFVFIHSVLELVSGESHLLDFNARRCDSINILIKLLRKLHDIDAELLPIGVKLIREVLKTGPDDVFTNWKESILNSGVGCRVDGDWG